MPVNERARTRVKRLKRKGLGLRFLSGADEPDHELHNMVSEFWLEFSKAPGEKPFLLERRSKERPAYARQNVGLSWLYWMSGYSGDLCLKYPFRTASSPRGVVTYNFNVEPAHRAMCLIANGSPPDGKDMALHRCGNGHLGCVNARHLYWGDASDNAKDAARHRRDGKPDAIPELTEPPHYMVRRKNK